MRPQLRRRGSDELNVQAPLEGEEPQRNERISEGLQEQEVGCDNQGRGQTTIL